MFGVSHRKYCPLSSESPWFERLRDAKHILCLTLYRTAQIICHLCAVYDGQFPTSDGRKFRTTTGEADYFRNYIVFLL